MSTPKSILIITDERVGQSTAFRTMDDFRQAMLAGGWTADAFQAFLDDEHEPDINDAELVRELDDGGLYVCEKAQNIGYGRYQTRYIYYRVWDDGSLRHIDTLDHPADEEDFAEM